jgi:hypothetical protein
MSAYYAMAYNDRIEIAVDGAIYEDDGTIIDLRKKFWKSDRFPLAFVGRGSSVSIDGVGHLLDVQCSFCDDVDEVLERLAAALERNARDGATPIDGLLAGWSKTYGPLLHWFTTFDGFEGFEPFRLYNVGAEWAGGPTPDAETLASFGFPWPGRTLAECAVDLFEAMRRTEMEHLAHPGRPMLYGVGGHVDLITVTAAGCVTERLHTWPQDRVGHKITPASAMAFA